MNRTIRSGFLALLLVFGTALSVSAQIKPTKQKPKTTEPTEQPTTTDKPTATDTPAPSENTDSKPSVSAKKKTAAKKTDQYFDESGGFKHRLWYGGSANLNFASGSTPSSQTSTGQIIPGQPFSLFTFGLTPMVGYKIIGNLSAGPRIGFNYNKLKLQETTGNILTVNLLDYNLGAFTRYKVFKNFFVHAEADYYNAQTPGSAVQPWVLIKDVNGKPFTFRDGATSYYGGIGYNSGGLLGYEIMALYNFSLAKSNIQQNPIDLRVGLTYNF